MLSSLWTFFVNVAIIFVFVMWFWLLITIIGDLFRRHDVGGFSKLLWVIFLIALPLLGVFFYILTQSKGMAERNAQQVSQAREDLRQFVGFSPADEIAKLEKLKADGVITADEYGRLRAKLIG